MGELDTVSAWGKLRRAEIHAHALNSDYGAWLKDKPFEAIPERNTDNTRFWFRLRLKAPPRLGTWALILGDCLHNARCVLDHLLYAVVQKELNGAAIPEHLVGSFGFPIRDTPQGFKSHVERKGLPKYMSVRLLGLVESVQPYYRGQSGGPPLMDLLRDFDNIDKHNTIHIALATMRDRMVEIDVKSADGQIATPIDFPQELVDGAEIAGFAVPRSAPNLNAKFTGRIAVVVNHAPGPSGGRYSSEIDGLAIALTKEAADVFEIFVAAYK